MECSDILDYAVRVKDEPRDASLIQNYNEIVDEKPDLKNIQLSPFPQESSTYTIRKCDIKLESELDNEVEIVVECEDVKPNFDLLTIQKVGHDFQNHLGNLKDTIKKEPAEQVAQQTDAAEQLNLNLDFEPVEQSKKRSITKESDHQNKIKNQIDKVHSGGVHACETCGKTFMQRCNLKIHIDSMHNGVKHSCDICGKEFSLKYNLKNHIDSIHNGISHSCDICGKTFTRKRNLEIHIDSVHNSIKHPCNVCKKKFSLKSSLQIHIKSVHNKINHTCDICLKTFSQKGYLKIHIDSMHNGVSHTCATCGKIFSYKLNLKNHIDFVHNGIKYACDICGKSFSLKRNLKRHIDTAHNGIITMDHNGLSDRPSLRRHVKLCRTKVSLTHVERNVRYQ